MNKKLKAPGVCLASCSVSARRNTLPMADLGSSRLKDIDLGTLYFAS